MKSEYDFFVVCTIVTAVNMGFYVYAHHAANLGVAIFSAMFALQGLVDQLNKHK